jgi:hypothetical protein
MIPSMQRYCGVAQTQATRFSFACVMRNFYVCVLKRNYRRVLREAVMLLHGLTADRADNSVFVRVSSIIARFRSFTHWTTKKFSTEYPL